MLRPQMKYQKHHRQGGRRTTLTVADVIVTSMGKCCELYLPPSPKPSQLRLHRLTLFRFATGHSSEDDFNVDALLKTTTGMIMEDLRII